MSQGGGGDPLCPGLLLGQSGDPKTEQGLLHLAKWKSQAGAMQEQSLVEVGSRESGRTTQSIKWVETESTGVDARGRGWGIRGSYRLKGAVVQCHQRKGFWTVVPEQQGCAHFRNAHLKMVKMARFTCM